MRYQLLEGSAPLELYYEGEWLNLYQLGVLHLSIQEITDKVSLGLLSQAGLIEPTWRRARYLPDVPFVTNRRLVVANVQSLEYGSLHETIVFGLAVVLADPNVIAVLQNLAANIIWAVSVSGVRGIRSLWQPRPPNRYRWYNRDVDQVEIGSNLRELLVALMESSEGNRARLTLKSRSRDGEEMEVMLEINED